MADGTQAKVSVVLTQQQAILSAAGKQAIRLVKFAGHQVIDHLSSFILHVRQKVTIDIAGYRGSRMPKPA
jgi:hypothetical protein